MQVATDKSKELLSKMCDSCKAKYNAYVKTLSLKDLLNAKSIYLGVVKLLCRKCKKQFYKMRK